MILAFAEAVGDSEGFAGSEVVAVVGVDTEATIVEVGVDIAEVRTAEVHIAEASKLDGSR